MFKSMQSPSALRLLLLLSVYFNVAFANLVKVRQTTTTETTAVSCELYSSIANLSTISSNSTYRAAFLRSTSDGTRKAVIILNTAQAQLPLLRNDATLNEQCGNATALALTEAETNFTNGIIGPFRIQVAPGADPTGSSGLITLIVVFGIVIFMSITFGSL